MSIGYLIFATPLVNAYRTTLDIAIHQYHFDHSTGEHFPSSTTCDYRRVIDRVRLFSSCTHRSAFETGGERENDFVCGVATKCDIIVRTIFRGHGDVISMIFTCNVQARSTCRQNLAVDHTAPVFRRTQNYASASPFDCNYKLLLSRHRQS